MLYAIRAMVDTFCAHGNYENRAKARTRYMQQTLGPDGLRRAFLQNLEAAKQRGGLDLELEPARITKTGTGVLDDARAIPQKQPGLYAVAYHPIGGCLPAGKPAQLAELLADLPGAECRVGPDETLYILNLTAVEAARALQATGDGAQTQFERSVACIGASICQQGVRDSQAALRRCVEAVRAANLPDGALPRISISGCPSSCAAHQAAALGFQGCVKPVPGGKPVPAFRLFVGGCDALGRERFGEPLGFVAEEQLPDLLVALGRAAAGAGLAWDAWRAAQPDALAEIARPYL